MSQVYSCLCGAEGRLVTEPREITIGHWSVTVDDTFIRCRSCGEAWYLPGQMDASQRKAAAIIREKHRLMSPDRIRDLRERLHLSQSGLERLLGVGPKTVIRWEKGTVVPGAAVSRLLELIERFPGAAVELGWIHGPVAESGRGSPAKMPWTLGVGQVVGQFSVGGKVQRPIPNLAFNAVLDPQIQIPDTVAPRKGRRRVEELVLAA